ncbi:MAG: LysM peptidoglycan-binding domain-containing protein [Chloroflexi bacterium]|jgi:LysM repeat protein|nr:LysM peptidoglycan-binding domain-containing protein [Chloroflexota bacterium]MBT3670537.1 LysM peptidoglycan-binding domain-containing protein [Chloroflexota bacterium]MBT4001951.1 LysM peptidoglycan-binding domain-containing protein [Chloroflexota bacterium]MBT4304172.1 LysM peptidoglycan-binding domain-containing protein [Chloroflexota bacterium]MBT4533469.1 LysM peptidoglycan-binding domain-containing protein [Chloroflexota bacterium]
MLNFKRLILFGLLLIFLSGCANDVSPTETVQPTSVSIQHYSTPTPTLVVIPPTAEIEPTEIPLPTPTPVVYQVVANDTLIGIAFRYSISLNDLLAANPAVDPNFLIIGTDLIIPTEGGVTIDPSISELPPEAVTSAGPVKCYSSIDGGLTCFWLLTNDLDTPLENVSARVSLLNDAGEIITSGTALLPLNVLPIGNTMPVMVSFPSIVSSWTQAQAQIVSALPVLSLEERYFGTQFSELTINISEDAISANVLGQFALTDPTQASSESWILAVAYDKNNNVVGIRRWESETGLAVGEAQAFSLYIYSLGPPIADIELFLESRP